MSDTYRNRLGAARDSAIEHREAQRALLLRHPDIADWLREPPLKLSTPANWSGYLPGAWLPEDQYGNVRPNPSPIRAQILAALMAAAAREDNGGPA